MTSITQDAEAPPRRRMAAPERREAILGAARDAFAEGSYHEISLDRVAEGAGISKALIYEHFPSKRDLHRALLESYFGELLERVVGAIADAEPGEGRLRAGLDAFLAFVEERRGAWRMLVLNMADPVIAERMERLRHEVAVLITARMVEEGPPGQPRRGPGARARDRDGRPADRRRRPVARQLVGRAPRGRARPRARGGNGLHVGRLAGVEQGERWDGPASG